MSGNLQFRRGLKTNLPTSAPSGMPLWCTDTKELYIGTGDGIHKIAASGSSSSQSTKSITVLPTSGTINLEDNSVNTIMVSGNVNFVLPEISDNTTFHEILVQVSMPSVVSFTLGTNNYLSSDAPDMSQAGLYNILFEYHVDTWFVGVVKKNGTLGQRFIKIDFGTYSGSFQLIINDGQDYYMGETSRTQSFTLYYPKGSKIDYTIEYYNNSSDPTTKTGTVTLDENTTIYIPDLLQSHEGIIDSDLEDLLG